MVFEKCSLGSQLFLLGCRWKYIPVAKTASSASASVVPRKVYVITRAVSMPGVIGLAGVVVVCGGHMHT